MKILCAMGKEIRRRYSSLVISRGVRYRARSEQ